MLRKVLVILIITTVEINEAKLSFHMERDIISNSVAECLSDIYNTYFPDNPPIFIHLPSIMFCEEVKTRFSKNEDVLFKTFNDITPHQQIIYGCYGYLNKTSSYLNKPGVAFIMLPDVKWEYLTGHLKITLRQMRIVLGHYGVPIVIVSTRIFASKKEKISTALALLNTAWINLNEEDVIILIPEVTTSLSSTDKNLSIEIYSWLPQTQTDPCLSKIDDIILLDRWISSEKKFLKSSNLFPEKNTIPENCKLNIGLYSTPPLIFQLLDKNNFDGVYNKILQIMRKLHNFTLSFSLVQSEQDEFDITTPEYFTNEAEPCHTTYPHFVLTAAWYVPVFPIPRWQSFIRVFSPTLWILITLAYISASITFWLTFRLQQRDPDIILIFIDILRTYLSLGIPIKFRGIIFILFFTVWLFYCIQVYTCYQSQLVGLLANPGSFPPISDLNALDESGFQRLSNIEFTEKSDLMLYPHCRFKECLDELAKRHNLAVLGSTYQFDSFIRFNCSISGKPQIVKVTDSLKRFYFVVSTTRGCKFVARLNTIHERIVESELTNKWFNDLNINGWEIKMQKRRSVQYAQPIIDFSSIQVVFYLLIIGLVLSFVTFVIEIFYSAVYPLTT